MRVLQKKNNTHMNDNIMGYYMHRVPTLIQALTAPSQKKATSVSCNVCIKVIAKFYYLATSASPEHTYHALHGSVSLCYAFYNILIAQSNRLILPIYIICGCIIIGRYLLYDRCNL